MLFEPMSVKVISPSVMNFSSIRGAKCEMTPRPCTSRGNVLCCIVICFLVHLNDVRQIFQLKFMQKIFLFWKI